MGWLGNVPCFWLSMFLHLIDDPRICNHLLIKWDDPSSHPPYAPHFWMRFTLATGTNGCTESMWSLTPTRFLPLSSSLLTELAQQTKIDRGASEYCSAMLYPWWLCNQWYAWHPLGMIKIINGKELPGQKLSTWQMMVDQIIQSLQKVQMERGI